jgi:hypothetical protein
LLFCRSSQGVSRIAREPLWWLRPSIEVHVRLHPTHKYPPCSSIVWKPDDIQVYPSQWRRPGVHSNLKGTQSDLEQSLSQCVAEATVLVWSRDPPLFMALHSVHISGRPMHRLNLKSLFFIIPPRAKISSCLCLTRHQWQGVYGER